MEKAKEMDFDFKCVEEYKTGDYEPMAYEEDSQSMPDSVNFAVVTLQDTDEVMVVASDWLSTDKKQCYWPPFKSTEKYVEAVKKNLEPSTGWKPWEKLNVIFHAEYDTYEEAVNDQVEQRALKDGLILYEVVTLQNSNELTVIPATWLNKERTQCYWPPFKSPEKCTEAVKYRLDPPIQKPWELLNIQVHMECVTYKQAKKTQKSLKRRAERFSFRSPLPPAPTSTLPQIDPHATYKQAKEKTLKEQTGRFSLKSPLPPTPTPTLPQIDPHATYKQAKEKTLKEHTGRFSFRSPLPPAPTSTLPQIDPHDLFLPTSAIEGWQTPWGIQASHLFFPPVATHKWAKEKTLKEHTKRLSLKSPLPLAPTSAFHPVYAHATKRKRLSVSSASSITSAKKTMTTGSSTMEMVKRVMKQVHVKVQATNQDVISTYVGDAISKMDKICDNKKITIGVFGKSGQGKSSLLNAILGRRNLLPSGCFGACTSVVTQVQANLKNTNYTAEIELFSKEEWEKELNDLFRVLLDENEDRDVEKITALFGADADKKTLEELKKDDKYAEIENVLSVSKKAISNSDVSAFANDVASYIQHSKSSTGHCYWPLVKSVTIKIPDCRELLEHIVLLDLPGTGDCNKIRNDLWKTKLRECSSVWIVSDISRAINDRDPWGIIQHCIQDLGPGGECKNINFICTRTDDIDPEEYLRSVQLSEDQISSDKKLKTCILHRNNCAKEKVKRKLKNLEIMKSKVSFITDVFTVSSKAYLDKSPHLEPVETEIPNLQDILNRTNRRINRELNRDHINEANGVLSYIQSIQLHSDEKMVEIKAVVTALQKNLAKALKVLDHQINSLHKILDQCLSKGVEKSVELCVGTKNTMMASVTSVDTRGFHKTLKALYKNKGYVWPKNWEAPLDLNMCLAKHMHDNMDDEFNLIFPVDANNKTGMSVQEQIDKFSIFQRCTAYPQSSIVYHMENFIRTEETKVKALLKREVVQRKKEIYSSIQRTIQNQMTAAYELAANEKGQGAMENMEKKITETIELLKYNMFKDAKMEVLNKFMDLKDLICKTLESELKRSLERTQSRITALMLMDVSEEIEILESLSRQVFN